MKQKKQEIKNKARLILLDCNAIIHRAYHALPPLTDRKGALVNAVYGFFTMFLKAVKELKPDYIAAAFDEGGETFRHREYSQYKAHRKEGEQELFQQIPIVQNMLKSFGVPILSMKGVEADDIIGVISKAINIENIIVTGDMDLLQLIDGDTKVYAMKRGISDTVIYDAKAVEDRYGFGPEFITDFKGLKGDPSDNIPGVPGVGNKTASELIKKFGSIEEIYKKIESGKADIKESLKKKLADNKDQAFLSKRLATIKTDIKIDFDLEKSRFGDFNAEEIKQKFLDLDMKTLVRQISNFKFQISNKLQIQNSKSGEDKEQKTLFGGADKSRGEMVREKIESYYNDGIFSKEIRDLEIAIIPVIEEMEKNGIKVDISVLSELSKKMAEKIEEITRKVYDFAGAEFNLSSPQQLSEILFDKLKLPIKDIKKTPGGVLSTSASELEKLANSSPIIPLVLRHRELEKLRNTYIDALPQLVDPKDGRIHTKFDQLGTVTGRISSSDPNLQNIPVRSEEGGMIRKAFVADEGHKLVSFDYSQIDLRCIAHLSGDEKMIEAFKRGEDIHIATAREVFGEENISDNMRRLAKTVNFGIIYGMGAYGMAARSGIDQKKAKEFIDAYFKKFSGVAEYIERTKQEAKKRGYVETLFGRKRYVKELQSKNWQLRSAGERMAINMPVQGTSADIVKMAMVKLISPSLEGLSDRSNAEAEGARGGSSPLVKETKKQINKETIRLLLQVHDDLLFEIKDDLIKNSDIVAEIKNTMENAVKLDVPLVVDVRAGENWGEMNKV